MLRLLNKIGSTFKFLNMKNDTIFDVIIVGGSYAGLSAAMALGRSLRNVLIIDAGKPCNRQTPHSHNFLTQDGKSPAEISALAKKQVLEYKTISFHEGTASTAKKEDFGFSVSTNSNEIFKSKKLILATGLKDIFPDILGFSECWGISILHCPYCHGYEVRNQETGIFANGEMAFELAKLISNWTKSLTVFTNGEANLTKEQLVKLNESDIKVNEKSILKVNHSKGYVENIEFIDGSKTSVKAIYARPDLQQNSEIPKQLGCEILENGLLKTDALQKTTVPDVYACGDNTAMRSLSMAVSTGSVAGAMVNKDLIFENF